MGKAKAKAKKKTTGARAKRDRRRKLATEAPASAEELLANVPGLDALQDVPAFDDLPVDEAQQAAFDDFCAQAEEPEQMQLVPWCAWTAGFRWWQLPTTRFVPSMP